MSHAQYTEPTEAFYKLADNSSDIIVRFDRECRHLYHNSTGLRLLGLPAERVMGRTLRETGVPEPYCGLWEERIRRTFASAQPLDLTDSFPVGQGLLCFESRCVPEFGPDGTVRSVLVISRDTTERRRKDVELEFSRGILASMGSAVAIIAGDGRFVYANQACCRLLGYSSDELLRLDVSELDPDFSAAVWPDHWQQVKKDGHRVVEVRYHSKAGGFIPIELLVNYVEIGGHEYHCLILQDISERKQVEEELRRSEANFKAMVEGSHDAIVLLDPDGVILCANAAMVERIHTRRAGGPVGDNIFDLLPPEVARIRKASLMKVVQGKTPLRIEDERNGQFMDSHVYPITDASGRVSSVAIFIYDITERKRAEAALRRSRDELECKVRERTVRLQSLAAELTQAEHRERRRIAHVLHEDLQQHLVAMQCKMSSMKADGSRRPCADDMDWMLNELARTIQISRDLTVRLRPPVLYEFGLAAALEWLADDMRARFGLVVSFSRRERFRLASDAVQAFAFEAVSELLMNVIKHSGAMAADVQVYWAGQDSIAIAVSDRGRGFDAAQPTQDMKFGLFSIRERAEAFGGHLMVTSEPGQGTRVVMTLPALREPNVPGPAHKR